MAKKVFQKPTWVNGRPCYQAAFRMHASREGRSCNVPPVLSAPWSKYDNWKRNGASAKYIYYFLMETRQYARAPLHERGVYLTKLQILADSAMWVSALLILDCSTPHSVCVADVNRLSVIVVVVVFIVHTPCWLVASHWAPKMVCLLKCFAHSWLQYSRFMICGIGNI